jgi:hypothetical protein
MTNSRRSQSEKQWASRGRESLSPPPESGGAGLHAPGHAQMTRDLAPQIGLLTKMADLRLYSNNLLALPGELGRLRWLPALRLSSNQLDSLADGLGNLESLTDLLVAENALEGMSPQVGRRSAHPSPPKVGAGACGPRRG